MGVSPGRWARRRWRRRRGRRSDDGDGPSWLDVEASALAASAAVMAPALTEGGPQKPENLLPALPAGGFLSAEQAKQVCQNREVLAQFVVSANVQPSKIDEQCLHGVPKDLIDDVINLKFGSGLDDLPDLIAAAPRQEQREAAHASNGAAIMSDESSMGDPAADNMCFFKTIMGPGETECGQIADIAGEVADNGQGGGADVNEAQVAADKQRQQQNEEDNRSLEQIMGFNEDMNLPQTSDIHQNVEEILQEMVIDSMETENRLTGGCGGITEVAVQSTVEGVPELFVDGEAFPLNLLNDVDVMGLCNDNMTDGVVVDQPVHHHQQSQLPQLQLSQLQRLQQQQIQATKQNELTLHQAQVERRQHELERRTSFLVRRLRKFQSRLVGEHVAEETSHVLELAQESAKKCLLQDLASLGPQAGNSCNYPELAVNVSSFLQKLQKSCTAQSNSIAVRQRSTYRYFGAGSKDNYATVTTNRIPVFGVPKIKLEGNEIEKVAGPLSTKLKILQDAYDSDCTASSSGGESCDEMQTFNNPHQQPLPIAKRASWRWMQDRASVASRWTWLQAQISDLEYKIRQQNEFQRQIRASKGLVMLEVEPVVVSSTTNITTAAASTVNGYSGVLPGSTTGRSCGLDGNNEQTYATTTAAAAAAAAASLGASRTRPFARSTYRKRRLLQLDGLHETSKKAARPANLRCTCDGGLSPCAICTGRREPTSSLEAMELMSLQERIAVVDSGYHPVLSLPDEVTHTVHMDAIIRSTEWQQKMMRGGLRIAKVKDKDGNERRSRKVSEHRTKYPAVRVKKSSSSIVTARIKRKVLKGKRNRGTAGSGGGGSVSERSNHSVNRRRAPKQQQVQASPTVTTAAAAAMSASTLTATTALQQQSTQQPLAMDEDEEASALSNSSKYSSPVPSPLQPVTTAAATTTATTTTVAAPPLPPPEKNTLKEKSSNSHSHSRLRQDSYDIDNIVIPYSVAASTRLEKLPYKEILIPKWRACDDDLSPLDVRNGAVQRPIEDNDFEDVSEEATVLRHERSEREENKRFMSFINLPYQSRLRHNRRTDSRADSGANTPDPMSPHAIEFGGDTMSPITSPPATPSNVHDGEQHSQTETHHRSGALQNALRRRTISQTTRPQKEEASSVANEEEHEQVLPYEPRSFPLTDDDYDKMLKEMPGGHLQLSSMSVGSQEEEKIDEAELDSQESDSTESALCDMEGEDPNDPEWTVAEARETEKERIRPTAKR